MDVLMCNHFVYNNKFQFKPFALVSEIVLEIYIFVLTSKSSNYCFNKLPLYEKVCLKCTSEKKKPHYESVSMQKHPIYFFLYVLTNNFVKNL